MSGSILFRLELELTKADLRVLLDAVAAAEEGRAPTPKGLSRSRSRAGETVISASHNQFALVPGGVALHGLPPIATRPIAIPSGLVPRHLILRLLGDKVSLMLLVGLPPHKRVYNSSAIYVTDEVKPRAVQGGAPSLGRRR